jgi:hypothetical protein
MDAMFRLSGAGKRDPTIDEWLNKTDALTAVARTWFKRMRACGDDVRELMHDGCPVVCVEDTPFAYVNVFKSHTNVGFFYGAIFPTMAESTRPRRRRGSLNRPRP